MSKTFTCCKLVERIKNSKTYINKWSEKDKYLGVEFLQRSTHPPYDEKGSLIEGYDEFFCEECKEWFNHNTRLQMPIIDAEIEKEKAEGTFLTNPETQKALKKFKKQADEYQKNLEEDKSVSLSFGKSPQE